MGNSLVNTNMLTGTEFDQWSSSYTTLNTNSADWESGGGSGSSTYEWPVGNASGNTLGKGTAVYFTSYSTASSIALVEPADGASASTARVVGLIKEDIADTATGSVVTQGPLTGLNTSEWAEKSVLYATSSGTLTQTVQPYPREVCFVESSSATNGILHVYPSMPTFQTGGAEGGDMQHLLTTTLDAAATEFIVESLNFDYWDYFIIRAENIIPVTDSVEGRIRFRGAGSDLTGDYAGSARSASRAGTASFVDWGTTDYATCGATVGNLSSEGVRQFHGRLQRNGNETELVCDYSTHYADGTTVYKITQEIILGDTTGDGIKFSFSSGNVASGAEIKVWGVLAS